MLLIIQMMLNVTNKSERHKSVKRLVGKISIVNENNLEILEK